MSLPAKVSLARRPAPAPRALSHALALATWLTAVERISHGVAWPGPGVSLVTRTPNGIDRVDMAYARHFLANGGEDDRGVLYLGPFGARCVSRNRAVLALDGIDTHYPHK